MKKAFISLMTALVLLLTGILTGHYYAYHQWGEIYQEEGDPVAFEEEKETEEEDVQDDMVQRQEEVKENGKSNFFSDLGQTLGGSPR